jgi:hypothetical protein
MVKQSNKSKSTRSTVRDSASKSAAAAPPSKKCVCVATTGGKYIKWFYNPDDGRFDLNPTIVDSLADCQECG